MVTSSENLGESLPSKSVTLIDVPDTKEFKAKFQYNYWTADEYENGLGSSEFAYYQIPSETFDATFVSRVRKLPRLVELSWKPSLVGLDSTTDTPDVSIRDNLDKIHSEETFTNKNFTTITFQDNQKDGKLQFFLTQFSNLLQKPTSVRSSMEEANFLMENSSEEITSEFLLNVLKSTESSKGLLNENSNEVLERLKNVSIKNRIENKVVLIAAEGTREDSVGIFSDETNTKDLLGQLSLIQEKAISVGDSNIINPLDYEFEILSYVSYRPVDSSGFVPTVRCLGYLIEKREIKSDGTLQSYPPIVIENPITTTTFDGQVRYGSIYYYLIKSVYLVDVLATDRETKQNLLVSFLVSSKESREQEVKTVETIPPPPPADFDLAWDYGERALRCTWNLPTNPQQDIKYIQLFRRASVYEPFQLIKMWDFNNSQTKVPLSEYPLPELYHKVPSFVGFYLDKEFTKDSKFIYAVCAIDAHAFTSNYSIQFEVSFDKYANKLIKKLISLSGAPKQYPNAFLNADSFVDSIQDSGHKNVKIVFNPEYIELFNKEGSNLRLLKTDRQNGKYRLNLINTDLQTQEVLDIVLKDKRPTLQTSIPIKLGARNIASKINKKNS